MSNPRSWLLIGLVAFVAGGAYASDSIADTLRSQTQELLDAVGSGDAAVWQRYLDDDVRYTAEDGSVLDKKTLLAQTKPLPSGVAGQIRIVEFQAVVHGPVAIVDHVDDELESYHGHDLHCRYRNTDTWLRTSAGWRLIGAQVLALRTDPPAIALPEARLREYAGTYELAPDIRYEIRLENGALVGVRAGRPNDSLAVEAPDDLFVPGQPRYRKIFTRDAAGRITGFVERREAWDLPWRRIDS